MYVGRQGRSQRVYHGMLEGRGESRGFSMYVGRQGRIQRVYYGMLEGRGGSRGFSMIGWKAGVDPEGLP